MELTQKNRNQFEEYAITKGKRRMQALNNVMDDVGAEKVSKEEFVNFWSKAFSMTEEELIQLLDRPDTPFFVKVQIGILLRGSEQQRSKLFSEMRDYLYGRPEQNGTGVKLVRIRKDIDGNVIKEVISG